jgi:hypothetical protein
MSAKITKDVIHALWRIKIYLVNMVAIWIIGVMQGKILVIGR